jgi:hypothetical protein
MSGDRAVKVKLNKLNMLQQLVPRRLNSYGGLWTINNILSCEAEEIV